MKRFKQVLTVLLALSIVCMMFASCSGTQTDGSSSKAPDTSSAASSAGEAKTAEPLKIKAVHIYNQNTEAPKDNTLTELSAKNVKEFVGREVQIEWVTYPTDEQTITQYVQMQDAAGTMPELCFLLNMPYESEAMDYVSKKSIFHEFTADLIREKLPNYTRRVEDYGFGVDDIVKSNSFINDGKLWGLPVEFRADTFPKLVDEGMREYPNYGYYWVVMRDDILKTIYPDAKSEAELQDLYVKNGGKLTIEDFANDVPIKNLDELYDYMQKVKDLGLKVGDKPVIPGGLVASSEGTGSLRWSLQTAMGIGWRWPLIWTDPLEESFYVSVSEKYYKPYIQWWNKIYNDGLIDPEMFIMKNDQYSAKAANGEYAIFNTSIGGALGPARELGKERGYGWRPFPVFYPVDMSILSNQVQYNSVRTQQVQISSKLQGQDLDDMLKWLDYFMTEQADDVSAWGSPDWYTGEGRDRRYKDGFDDLMKWSVYGTPGEKDGKYYGITAGVASDYTSGNNRQLQIRPIGLIQASDAGSPYAPYYIYERKDETLLRQVDLVNVAVQAGWDAVLAKVDRYAKVGWQESDYDSGPLWDEYNANLNPDVGNVLVQAIHSKPAEFEKFWDTYLKMHKDAGIDAAVKDSAERLAKVWEESIKPNKMK